MSRLLPPPFAATGIGSLPHRDPGRGVAAVLGRLALAPYWPQFPHRTAMEDMNLMYAAALRPLVGADPGQRSLVPHPGLSREEALAAFYERLFSGELADFQLKGEDAAGFGVFLERVAAAPAGAFPWVKGHVTGPLTLAGSVIGLDGKALLYDEEVAEAIARGLGAAAAAQAGQLAVLGRPVLVFIDEPFLSGYGSAFTPLTKERVLALLGATLEELHSRAPEVPAGVHCCGNTDWGMLVEAGFEVINLDSHAYGEGLMLYPREVAALLARGGAIAWGAVPAGAFRGDETAQGLWERLAHYLKLLEERGVPGELLRRGGLVTPACGLGSLDEARAERILMLTAQVSELARAEYAAR